jgi:2-polyprenyl-6-methoxyphenol hydroxylase-like FAD-dependent oxidoreductase
MTTAAGTARHDAAFDTDVLIVGAGPTGLVLARELHSLGVTVQVVDRAPDAVHESRALAIQARTLEVLARDGLADELIAAGNPTGSLVLHERASATTGRTHTLPLFETGLGDTRFPFLLFLPQAATERILVDHLAGVGVEIRRGLTLSGLTQDEHGVTAVLDSSAAQPQTAQPHASQPLTSQPLRSQPLTSQPLTLRARYLVGCDGAHSMTRRLARITFNGRAYPHRFLLADVEVDGLAPGRVHVYLGTHGPLLLFPLGTPATWRLIALLPRSEPHVPVTLPVVQAAVARHTREPLTVHDPAWLTEFTVSSRLADAFRSGRVFLAGDAAHIHSPAGGQGMNTGIQDAANLGWKLALVCRGEAGSALLNTYERERMPVARSVVTTTDRGFRVATARVPLVRDLRATLGPRIGAVILRSALLRRAGFRVLSELGLHYRHSPLSVEGRTAPIGGPRPGHRFPQPGMDAPGEPATSTPVGTTAAPARSVVRPPVFRMLLCGAENWSEDTVQAFGTEWAHLVTVERLPDAPGSRWSAAPRSAPGSRHRPGTIRHPVTAQYLVRWDGYVGYRAGGTDLAGAAAYLRDLGARPRPRRSTTAPSVAA